MISRGGGISSPDPPGFVWWIAIFMVTAMQFLRLNSELIAHFCILIQIQIPLYSNFQGLFLGTDFDVVASFDFQSICNYYYYFFIVNFLNYITGWYRYVCVCVSLLSTKIMNILFLLYYSIYLYILFQLEWSVCYLRKLKSEKLFIMVKINFLIN